MTEQGEQIESPKRKKANPVTNAIAALLVLGGTMTGGGVLGYEVGKHLEEDTLNRYGVLLEEGTTFSPWEYQVIVGKLALKRPGEPEPLGYPGQLSDVFVAGEIIDTEAPLPILIAKSRVSVYPQSNRSNVNTMAKRLIENYEEQNPAFTANKVVIPGFKSPETK